MGLELLHRRALGARRRGLRRAGLHLRHARDARRSPSSSPCRSASASRCSSPRWRRRGCAGRSSTLTRPAGRRPVGGVRPVGRARAGPQAASASTSSIARPGRAPIPMLGSVFGDPVRAGERSSPPGIILAIMITPIITSLTREVIETTPPGRPRRRARPRRHPLGDDQRRRHAAHAGRPRRRRDARPRPGDGRDDRRRPRHRLVGADHRATCSRRATRCRP